MTDTKLRELERRWKETGSYKDEAAYLLEQVRVGDDLDWPSYCRLEDYSAELAADYLRVLVDRGLPIGRLELAADCGSAGAMSLLGKTQSPPPEHSLNRFRDTLSSSELLLLAQHLVGVVLGNWSSSPVTESELYGPVYGTIPHPRALLGTVNSYLETPDKVPVSKIRLVAETAAEHSRLLEFRADYCASSAAGALGALARAIEYSVLDHGLESVSYSLVAAIEAGTKSCQSLSPVIQWLIDRSAYLP